MISHFVTCFHQIVMHHIFTDEGLAVVRKSLAAILMTPEKFRDRLSLKWGKSKIGRARRALNFLQDGLLLIFFQELLEVRALP